MHHHTHSYPIPPSPHSPQLEQIATSESASSDGRAPPAGAPAAPRLSDECRALADVAAPPNMKRVFEESLSVALLGSQLSKVEAKTGLPLLARDARTGAARGVTLTGWTALVGILALVVMLLGGAVYAWRHYYGVGDGTTVVLKSRSGYRRVSNSNNT